MTRAHRPFAHDAAVVLAEADGPAAPGAADAPGAARRKGWNEP